MSPFESRRLRDRTRTKEGGLLDRIQELVPLSASMGRVVLT